MTYDTRTHTVQTHGGDWAGYEQQYGKEPLDFSMNVNPLGIPEAVRQAIAEAAAEADRYPDPLCRKLREAIARREEVPAEWIFCGNGAADIIFRLAQGLQKPRQPQLRADGVRVRGRHRCSARGSCVLLWRILR
jgi:threonine-phosphate decarboxylase